MHVGALLDPGLTSPRQFVDAVAHWPSECSRDAAYLRCRTDLAMFTCAHFSHVIRNPFSAFHRDIFGRPKPSWTRRDRQMHTADAAPRGYAKSTLGSYVSPAHDIVYGIEAYIVIVSTTADLSDDLVKELHKVFSDPEAAPSLHADYGPFTVRGTKTDFVVRVPGLDPAGTRVKSFSFEGAIRGTKHGPIRPTKVIVDDGEHPKKVRTPHSRSVTWKFFTEDIGNVGDDYTRFDVVGTVLHPKGMLPRLLVSPRWTATKWTAVISWPERQDLWDECRRLWSNVHDEGRARRSEMFYERHKASMDRGAKLLWPEKKSVYGLMTDLWGMGEAAFWAEHMNEPRDPSKMVFDVDRFARFEWRGSSIVCVDSHGREQGDPIPLADCAISVWLDPARSAAQHSDYSCIAVVAQDPKGLRYVLSCELMKIRPDDQRARMWAKYERYPGAIFGYENNRVRDTFGDAGFMRETNERRQRGENWRMHVEGHHSQANKEERISDLQPFTANGWLRFSPEVLDDEEVMGQFRDHPSAENDDAPDAIERACWQLGESGIPEVKGGTPW